MSRVPRVIVDPKDPLSIVEHLGRVQRVVDGEIEFGDSSDPNDPTSTQMADGVAHNGTVVNLKGSWFTAVLESNGRHTITCIHNLDTAIPTGVIPVCWQAMRWRHDGTGANPATAQLDLSVWYMGGTVAANSIDLEFSVIQHTGVITINADHPVLVDLFFTAATR